MCELKANLNSAVYHAHALRDNVGLHESPEEADCEPRKGIYIHGIVISLGLHATTNEMCTIEFFVFFFNTGHPPCGCRCYPLRI